MNNENFYMIKNNWNRYLLEEAKETKLFTEEIILSLVKEGMTKYRASHPDLDKFLTDLTSRNIKWGITGGGVRDFIFGYEPNDIDVLIDAPDELLDQVINDGGYKLGKINAFGGRKMDFDGMLTDVWTVSSTWGIKHGYKKNKGLESYPKVTTFSADAVVVSPDFNEIHADKLIKTLETGKVKIVFDKTPIPLKTAIKAYRLFHKYGLKPGKSVSKFIKKISKQLSDDPSGNFQITQ